jgi:hypothetical protein
MSREIMWDWNDLNTGSAMPQARNSSIPSGGYQGGGGGVNTGASGGFSPQPQPQPQQTSGGQGLYVGGQIRPQVMAPPQQGGSQIEQVLQGGAQQSDPMREFQSFLQQFVSGLGSVSSQNLPVSQEGSPTMLNPRKVDRNYKYTYGNEGNFDFFDMGSLPGMNFDILKALGG